MSQKNYLSKYAKSFNWAGFFLPKDIYLRCSSLYDFCRTLDNIADGDDDLSERKKNLLDFRESFFNKNFNNSIIQNMWHLMDKCKISIKIVKDLFDGIESDLKEEVRINTKKELLIYSYRVAGTVGLMMAKILKVEKPEALRAAIDLGIAMQLTNISRDVIEDSNNNRFYINPTFDSIKETLTLANFFYENSFSSIKEIPFNLRFSILVARRVYRKIGYKILTTKNIKNYNGSGKIYVTIFGKTIQTILSVSDLARLLLGSFQKPITTNEHFLINEEININERI